MIRLRNVRLPRATRSKLNKLQQQINDKITYEEQVALAKELFPQKNRANNSIFREVRKALTRMCAGARRCCYCEDSYASDIDHIRPKDIYPEVTFVWENYIYACALCNRHKSNRFSIFSATTGEVVNVARRANQQEPPEHGESVFINPREEDALELMWLDIQGTFHFVSVVPESTREYERVKYTIKILDLNDREDTLPLARRVAFGNYRARLREYINQRDNGVSKRKLNTLKKDFHNVGQPTGWVEMKRQYEAIPELKVLFDSAPEALNW
jgi:uncharacterized protein (TIGR02646 family)